MPHRLHFSLACLVVSLPTIAVLAQAQQRQNTYPSPPVTRECLTQVSQNPGLSNQHPKNDDYIWNFEKLGPQTGASFKIDGYADIGMDYRINGTTVLATLTARPNAGNLLVGSGAGIPGMIGRANTFVGTAAGANAGVESEDTFVGYMAGDLINCHAMAQCDRNTFIGYASGKNYVGGSGNTFTGAGAGGAINGNLNTGYDNTFYGYLAGHDINKGVRNVFIGAYSGTNINNGRYDTLVGPDTGLNIEDGGYDIYIGENLTPSSDESNVIRIGRKYDAEGGTGQNTTYIAGINGAAAGLGGNVQEVCVDNLGTLWGAGSAGCPVPSSGRFKEHVRDMGDNTNALMKLRPVTFFYRDDYDDGSHLLQYGLIAEEVAQVYPELVAYDKNGEPYSVRYQYLGTMLLNEVQKQFRRDKEQAEVIKAQQGKIESQRAQITALQERLTRLEVLVDEELQKMAEAKP